MPKLNLAETKITNANLAAEIITKETMGTDLPYRIGLHVEETVTLDRANFSDTDLSGMILHKVSLRGASFDNAKLVETNFYECDLVGAKFNGANLQNVNFTKSDLYEVSFEGALNLEAASLLHALNVETIHFGKNGEKILAEIHKERQKEEARKRKGMEMAFASFLGKLKLSLQNLLFVGDSGKGKQPVSPAFSAKEMPSVPAEAAQAMQALQRDPSPKQFSSDITRQGNEHGVATMVKEGNHSSVTKEIQR